MLHITGAALVIFGGMGIGWYASGLYRLRLRLLWEISQVLQILYGEIEYAGTDMVELLYRLGRREGCLKDFFGQAAAELEKRQATFDTVWSDTLSAYTGQREYRLLFTGESIRLLQDIGRNLGNADRDTQLHTLQLFQKQLDTMIGQAELQYEGQARVCRVVGTVGGVFTAVLLL